MTMSHRPDPRSTLALACLGLFIALWPVLVVHGGYAVSIQQGDVPACNPYWDGCTSISRAGRHGWANHLFRGALLPYTTLLAASWWISQRWLRSLGWPGSRWMLAFGWTGALFMALYLTFLGSEGESYQLMRRYGINVYFGGTFAAQMLLLVRLRSLARARPAATPAWLVPALALAALGVLASGAAFLVVKYGLALGTDRLENALEWNVALLMQAFLLIVAQGWLRSGLRLSIDAARAG